MEIHKANYKYLKRCLLQTPDKRTIALTLFLVSIAFHFGCTNWKKKYDTLNVEYENIQGLLAYERSGKNELSEQSWLPPQSIDKDALEDAGFGRGHKVKSDSSAGTVTVTLVSAGLFSPGKALLKRSGRRELDHICSVLRNKYSGKQIDIVGHTDSDLIKKSRWKDNWEFAAERTLTIVRYLIAHGIAEDKIRQVSCGSARPTASNATASGKAKNQRVEIVIYMK